MAETVYILCGVTSLGCAIMLWRGYQRTRLSLLFWSCACFICFAATNIFLFVDLVMLPSIDFTVARTSLMLAGLLMLLYGMIGEAN